MIGQHASPDGSHPPAQPGSAASGEPGVSSVSIIGVGALGTALAQAFLNAGHRTTVWNRTAAKATALADRGAIPATSVVSAIAASPIVVISVSTYDDARAFLDPVVDTIGGRVVVNLTSGTPDEARAMANWAVERHAGYLDGAAMSGTRLIGRPAALFLYSGDPVSFATSRAVLASLGRAVHLSSDPGVASLYDTALLTLNMGVLVGFYHAIALVRTIGVDAQDFASVAIDYLPFVTGLLRDHAAQVDARDFPGDDGTLAVVGAAMEHVIDTSVGRGIDPVVPAGIKTLIDRAVVAGHGDDGLARLVETLAPPPT